MKELYHYINDLVDKIAEKLNVIHSSFSKKEDKSNKKQGLSSTDSDHYPSVPAVKDGIDQAVIVANNYTDDVATGINKALVDKVDKEDGKGLSDENFTLSLKQKLETMESSKFRGTYTSLSNLKAEYPEGQSQSWHGNEGGWYADVGPANEPSERYIWDHNDYEWVAGGAGGITAEQVKNLYESNDDTNALTDSRKTKLDGVETGAQKNVQADMSETDQTKDSFVKNKKTRLSQFENDSRFVKDIIKVEGVGALKGGGKLDNDIEIDLNQETKDDIADGVIAKEFVDNLGVRNYLLNSNIDQRGHGYIRNHKIYYLSERIETGDDVVVRMKIDYFGEASFDVRSQNADGIIRQIKIPDSGFSKIENGLYEAKFKFDNLIFNKIESIMIFKQEPGMDETWDLDWILLTKGKKTADWTPAPEDLLFKEEANALFAPLTGYPDWAEELEDLLNF